MQIVTNLIVATFSICLGYVANYIKDKRKNRADNSLEISRVLDDFPLIMAGHREMTDILMNSDRAAWEQRKVNLALALHYHLNGGKKPAFLGQ